MIEFTPMTEQEINELSLLPDGDYLADVYDALDTDNHGNPLLTATGVSKFNLVLNVYNAEGKTRKVNCVLTPAFMKLFKHFFDATNQQDDYQRGQINIMNIRNKKDFVVTIGKRTYISNKTGQEMTVNNVLDFKKKETTAQNDTIKDDFDDVISF